MNSPFTPVLQGADRVLVVAENQYFVAVLERKPLVLGHVVVISKRYEDHWFDLHEEELASAMVFAKPIADAIRQNILCKKVGVAVIGLETRHAHLHLVPINTADDLNFTREKVVIEEERLLEVVNHLRSALKFER